MPSRRSDAQLAERLGRDIVDGIFPAGSVLPSVAEMGERFSASRTTLREAYSKLSGKGLIIARPKVGTRVRPRADWNLLDPDVLAWRLSSEPEGHFVEDLFTLRHAIEPVASEIAATMRTPDSLARIADAIARMERFKNGDGDLIGADVDFHVAILEATQNPFLAALGGLIRAALECSFRFTWIGAASIRDDRLEQHHRVLAAISARAPKTARARMVELLTDSYNDMRKFRESLGDQATLQRLLTRSQARRDTLEIRTEDTAEVFLGRAIWRPIIIGNVKMGDAPVEGPTQNGALSSERVDATEIPPQPERNRGQHEPAAAAAAIGQRLVSLRRRRVAH